MKLKPNLVINKIKNNKLLHGIQIYFFKKKIGLALL
jgi:hypothetical protein